jgi:hypothetical protein
MKAFPASRRFEQFYVQGIMGDETISNENNAPIVAAIDQQPMGSESDVEIPTPTINPALGAAVAILIPRSSSIRLSRSGLDIGWLYPT